jgi:hypothetical protein
VIVVGHGRISAPDQAEDCARSVAAMLRSSRDTLTADECDAAIDDLVRAAELLTATREALLGNQIDAVARSMARRG